MLWTGSGSGDTQKVVPRGCEVMAPTPFGHLSMCTLPPSPTACHKPTW